MRLVVTGADAERVEIARVEGQPLDAPAVVRVLGEGAALITLEVTMPAGQGSPPHTHDHESVGYVVRGRVRMVIGGEVSELAPGDGFLHPPGVEHQLAAVGGEAVWLEVKTPPVRTWER